MKERRQIAVEWIASSIQKLREDAIQDWCLEQFDSKEYKSVVEEQRRQYIQFDKRDKKRQYLREEAIREKAKREKDRALKELREEETLLREQFCETTPQNRVEKEGIG